MPVPQGYWKNKENRVNAIRDLVEKLNKPPNEITQKDFSKNGLMGLLKNYYSKSPFKALKGAGYDLEEWGMLNTPKNYWKEKDNRVRAIIKLVEKLDKPTTELKGNDFVENNLGGLYCYYNSTFKALKDAGYGIEEWEMSNIPKGYWKEKENRVRAITRLVERLGKPPNEITVKDFKIGGLWGLFTGTYQSSPFSALKDAGYDIEELEMTKTPSIGHRLSLPLVH